MMEFEILGEIRDIETIATGRGVYIRLYLDRTYGKVAGASGKEEPPCNLPMGQWGKPRFTGLRRMESDGRISKSRGYCDE